MNRSAVLSLLFASVLVVSGCQEQGEIRSYDVERLKTDSRLPSGHPSIAAQKVPERMLGVIVPVGEQAWFFKITGSPQAVSRQELKLLQLIGSLSADKKSSLLTWKLPNGWTQEKGSGKMGALFTIRFDDDTDLVLNVSRLKIFGNSWDEYLLMNLNRWRRQVGMQGLSLEELKKKLEEKEAGTEDRNDNIVSVELGKDLKVTLANFLGMKQSSGGMRPPFANMSGGPVSRPPVKQPDRPQVSKLKHTVPKGWKPGKLSVMRKAAFVVTEGDEKVETTVMTAGGELLPNVNRWRGQVNLKAIDKDELKKTIQPIRIDGHDGMFFEIVGTGGISILAVMVTVDNQQWFIKLTGNSKLAAKEKERFLAYAKSIKF